MADVSGFGEWYDAKQGDTGDPWHRTLIDPALFRRLGDLAQGTRVLDIGCGNGYLARRLARGGARIVGVDASAELITAARAYEAREPLGITYHQADAARVPLPGGSAFDVAIANMSLLDIEDARGAIGEVARLVRPGGRFVFSISHPCFDVDTRSAWVIERTAGSPPQVFRKITGYREPHADTYRWLLPDGRVATTVGFHRPLEWYAHTLRAAGFVLLDLEESRPTEEFEGRVVQREWVAEIPMHLVVEARREPSSSG